MSWFAEFNPQIDWYNPSTSLDLDAEQYTVISIHTTDSFPGIDLCNADLFSQLLSNPKSGATTFSVHISHVEALTSCSLMYVGTGHP